MFDNTGLYIHIPFCVKKCNYCDFCSVGIGDGDECLTDRLVNCLIKELKNCYSHNRIKRSNERIADNNHSVDHIKTVFIGGGTPSILPSDQMEELLSEVTKYVVDPDEFSIECNPGTVDIDKLKLYKSHGINRISFGLQSANEDEMERLGRIHTWRDFLESYEMARSLGFENINVDLMTAIPGQTVKSLAETLEKVVGLAPEHVSVYSLILEEGTPFFEKYKGRSPVDEYEDRELYELTCRKLGEAGYRHYEVSNYALPGRECRHNRNYWRRGDYIGIGPAAASHSDGRRRTNVRDIRQYMSRVESGEDPTDEMEELTPEQKLLEAVYLGLRTSEGVRMSYLLKEFGIDLRSKWGNTPEYLSEEGLLYLGEDTIHLTEKGFWLSDYILDKLM